VVRTGVTVLVTDPRVSSVLVTEQRHAIEFACAHYCVVRS